MRKHLFLAICVLYICISIDKSIAQQTTLYTQYAFNPLVINPAYAGSHETLSMTGFVRKQWQGIEGAPLTATFSAHAPVKNEKMGLGLVISNDQITIFNQTVVSGIYAYRLPVSEKGKLSMGLQAGVSNYTAKYSQLSSYTPNDPALGNGDYNSFSPSFGFGLFYSTDLMYIGLSIPYLSSNLLRTKDVVNNLTITNHYFLSAGYVFSLSKDFKFKPNLLVRYVPNTTLQADFNFNFLYRNLLWLGVSCRTFNTLSFITQLHVNEQLRLGYGYDVNTGSIQRISAGSHEIMVNYIFLFSKRKVVSPRYF